jgi:hypothetical protein
MCEALCDGVEECGSFDMHKYVNRCYLNQRYCDPTRNPYDYPDSFVFGLEEGIYTHSGEYDFVYKSKSPTVYTTHDGMGCANQSAILDSAVNLATMDESCATQCGGPSVGKTASALFF